MALVILLLADRCSTMALVILFCDPTVGRSMLHDGFCDPTVGRAMQHDGFCDPTKSSLLCYDQKIEIKYLGTALKSRERAGMINRESISRGLVDASGDAERKLNFSLKRKGGPWPTRPTRRSRP